MSPAVRYLLSPCCGAAIRPRQPDTPLEKWGYPLRGSCASCGEGTFAGPETPLIHRVVEGEGSVGGPRDGVRCHVDVYVRAARPSRHGFPGTRLGSDVSTGQTLRMRRFDAPKPGVEGQDRWSAWSSDDIDLALILNEEDIGAILVAERDLEMAKAAFFDAPWPIEVLPPPKERRDG